jgi:hypothetical protein
MNRNTIRNYLIDKEKQTLLVVFLFAFLLRGLFVIFKYNSTGATDWSDDWEYLSMGRQIADGNWSPVIDENTYMQVGPILPMLVAIGIKIFGNPNLFVFIYNIVITSLVVPLLFYLGKELFSRKVGFLLAAWGIFYIDYFKYNPHLLKEPTVFFFLPLTLFLMVKAIRVKNSLFFLLLSAVSFAWMIHADERYLFYFPILIVMFFLFVPFRLKHMFQTVTVWTGFIFIFMLPWGIHNYNVFGQVVVISPRTTAITSKFLGDDISNLNFSKKENFSVYEYELNRYQTGNHYTKYGIAPREYKGMELYARSFVNFWQPAFFKGTFIQFGARFQKWSLAHNLCGILFYGIFLPFYIVGIFLLFREKYTLGFFIAIIPVLHSFLHTYMIWPLERYRSPIVFIVVMIGWYSIVKLFEGISHVKLNKG